MFNGENIDFLFYIHRIKKFFLFLHTQHRLVTTFNFLGGAINVEEFYIPSSVVDDGSCCCSSAMLLLITFRVLGLSREVQ